MSATYNEQVVGNLGPSVHNRFTIIIRPSEGRIDIIHSGFVGL